MLSLIALSMLFASMGSFVYLLAAANNLHRQAVCPAEIKLQSPALRGTIG